MAASKKLRHSPRGATLPSLLDLLHWLEHTWTQDAGAIKLELNNEHVEELPEWIEVLTREWRRASDDGKTLPADLLTNFYLDRVQAYLAMRLTHPRELLPQLCVAWMWARGWTPTDPLSENDAGLTGFSIKHVIDNILTPAEALRPQFQPNFPSLWKSLRAPQSPSLHVPPWRAPPVPTAPMAARSPTQDAFDPGRPKPPIMAPSRQNRPMFGRDDDLKWLFDKLEIRKPEARDVPPVAVRGLGGIGKTTLAMALAHHEELQRVLHDGVLWAALGPRPNIRECLNAWGHALNVDLLPVHEETECRDRLRMALYHRKALLVIDDIWDVTHGRYFEVAGPWCRFLVTTREPPVANSLATMERTRLLDVLQPEAALEVLRRLAPDVVNGDEPTAKELCKRMERLPLALTLAGLYLAKENAVPGRMKMLLGELIASGDKRINLPQDEQRLGLPNNEPVTLGAILGLSVKKLSPEDQARFALLSSFPSEPVTWESKAAAHLWECSLQSAEATISQMAQRGLVEPIGERYWMHALLVDYARSMNQVPGV
ncbi:NB-ARC domain-containing protein [Polyangium mundeleinium]|uniref:NB-ARC domain-containing protein n=1 Tax=Polyangium mundeleinium TaxID=2995306 RepID=A0ABT5EN09_9BACT|nr:NB-ARC domain-containing protein [Polyangium mundeleinium]MDC0743220.1 NB-ARC domain-containing protein [Polyangium mundeleinium]